MTQALFLPQTHRRIRRCAPGVIALAATLVPLAHAQLSMPSYDNGHYYGGISVGQARVKTNDADVRSLLLPGVAATGINNDNKDTAYKLFGGYQMNRQLALEAGYFNLGSSSFNASTFPSGNYSGQTKVQGLNLDLVATLPLTERLSAQARVGAQYARSSSSFNGTGAAANVPTRLKDSGTNLKMGLGVQYELSSALWIRGEIERYRVNSFAGQRRNIDVASVSLVFPFGRSEPVRMASAPPMPAPRPMVMAPVAPTPPPAPVVVQAPPPAPVAAPTPPAAPPRQRFSLAAETLFGFDAAQIRPEGRTALDTLGRQIAAGNYEAVSVEGHTDRLGSSDYNQALSMRRAEVVRSYLVDQVRLDGSRLKAVGLGESQPTTAASACPDALGKTRLITCLQPDRRVDIEVTGTR